MDPNEIKNQRRIIQDFNRFKAAALLGADKAKESQAPRAEEFVAKFNAIASDCDDAIKLQQTTLDRLRKARASTEVATAEGDG